MGGRTGVQQAFGTKPVYPGFNALVQIHHCCAFRALVSYVRSRGEVAPFATFTTTRSKARLGSVGVDADVADFGLAVLELEVMCADAAEVPGAEAEILRVAELLGAEPLGETGGKLVTYIKRYCPGVFAQLVEARILKTSLLGRLSRFVQRFRRGRSVHT